MKFKFLIFSILLAVFFFLVNPSSVRAAAVSVSGKAAVMNTGTTYLDFTNYNANVTIDNITGNFSGYAFLEDFGWVDFGTTDNPSGPTNVNLTSGAVTGKAYVLNTAKYIDFTNYSSNVTVNISSGVFSGYGFSEDAGWLDFTDTGVSTASTLDAVVPLSFNLEEPGDKSYTTKERPTFKWKTTTDASSSMSKYKVEISSVILSGAKDPLRITLDDIPISRTASDNYQYETDKYIARYHNFDDNDSSNDSISVYTKSSQLWSDSENDGKLNEGKITWKVKAVDSVGNEREESRILFVDRTGPSVEITQINAGTSYVTTDRTPTIFGKITDPLNGQPQGIAPTNKIASGPEKVEIRIEKENYLSGSYTLHTLATINLRETYWSSDGSRITDNSKNTSNKYSPFEHTPSESLSGGNYKITLTGKDLVGNTGTSSFTLKIVGFSEFLRMPGVGQAIEELEKETGLGKEELEELLKEQNLIIPEELKEPSKIIELLRKLISAGLNLWWQGVDGGKKIAGLIFSTSEETLRAASELPLGFLAYRKQRIEEQQMAFGLAYFHLTQRSSGIAETSLLALAKGTDKANKGIEKVLEITSKPALAFSQDSKLARAWNAARESIGKPASQEALALTNRLKIATSTFAAIMFDKEPTRIADVKLAEVGQDYAVISWKTNHYATSKVNYGETLDYGQDIQSDKRVKEHRLKITGLKPGNSYVYEVMSQNKNYVYDARHEFRTLEE